MADTWIAMLVVWGVVEFIQYLRKKPFPSRMRTGALWGVLFSTFAMYGQMPAAKATLFALLIALLINLCGAGVVYLIRVLIARLWERVFRKDASAG